MKPTLLPVITETLMMQYLNKEFYPSKQKKEGQRTISYFYEVKYVIKGGEAKGVSYKRDTPKPFSRKDTRRMIARGVA